MPGADDCKPKAQQSCTLSEKAAHQPVHRREGKAGHDGLWQPYRQRGQPHQRHKGDGQPTFQYAHAASPGGKVTGIGISPGVHPIVKQGPGFISGIGFVLVQPPGYCSQLPQPHGYSYHQQQQH